MSLVANWQPASVVENMYAFQSDQCLDRDEEKVTRPSPQGWSGRSTTTHILLNLHALIWDLEKAVRLFIASLHRQPMCSEMFPTDIFVDLRLLSGKLKWVLFDLLVWGIRGCGDQGLANSIGLLRVPNSYPLPHVVYLLLFFFLELFSWLQNHFHPPIRPGHDAIYCCISYFFVERHKCEPAK